jgi:hypothetical protein
MALDRKGLTRLTRNHLLLKLVKTILPEFDPANAIDQRVQRVTTYLRYIEKEIFVLAASRVHYCELVAEKMSAIKQELEEKKQTRLRYQNNNTTPTIKSPLLSQILW